MVACVHMCEYIRVYVYIHMDRSVHMSIRMSMFKIDVRDLEECGRVANAVWPA